MYLPFSNWIGSKRTSVWISINRKLVNTIWFQVNLIIFREKFCACRTPLARLQRTYICCLGDWWVSRHHGEPIKGHLIKPLDMTVLWCSRGFRRVLNWPPQCRKTEVSGEFFLACVKYCHPVPNRTHSCLSTSTHKPKLETYSKHSSQINYFRVEERLSN